MITPCWTISIPIYNLEINQDIGGVFEIERIKFVSAQKIPRIRRRLNLPYTISDMNRLFGAKETSLFTKAPSYAFISTNDPKDEKLLYEHRLIKEAIWILRSSQFARQTRRHDFFFGLPEHGVSLYDEEYTFEMKDDRAQVRLPRKSPIQPYTLDKAWQRYIKNHFFFYLVKILNKNISSISQDWRWTLRKASILAAKSHYASELSEAFLHNIIAIETLLSYGEQAISKAIYDRLFAFFGWMIEDDATKFKEMVQGLYKRRSALVHNGEYKKITVMDVINTDEILRNLLYNICRNINFFSSKEQVVQFSSEIQARKTLGLKLKRPKTLRYITLSSKRTPKAIEELRRTRKW